MGSARKLKRKLEKQKASNILTEQEYQIIVNNAYKDMAHLGIIAGVMVLDKHFKAIMKRDGRLAAFAELYSEAMQQLEFQPSLYKYYQQKLESEGVVLHE